MAKYIFSGCSFPSRGEEEWDLKWLMVAENRKSYKTYKQDGVGTVATERKT